MTGAIITRGRLDTDMYTGRILSNHEAEIKMMALTSRRLPAKHQKQERGMRDRFFLTFVRNQHCRQLISDC